MSENLAGSLIYLLTRTRPSLITLPEGRAILTLAKNRIKGTWAERALFEKESAEDKRLMKKVGIDK